LDRDGIAIHQVIFRDVELARVSVSNDGDTDLELYIYDKMGNLIESDTTGASDCRCTWHPLETSPYTIRIKGRGSVSDEYMMLTNGNLVREEHAPWP
jgi:hypothetical protein